MKFNPTFALRNYIKGFADGACMLLNDAHKACQSLSEGTPNEYAKGEAAGREWRKNQKKN